MARTGHVMAILTLTILTGCRPSPDMRDQRLVDLASESMDRQAEQNQQLARLRFRRIQVAQLTMSL